MRAALAQERPSSRPTTRCSIDNGCTGPPMLLQSGLKLCRPGPRHRRRPRPRSGISSRFITPAGCSTGTTQIDSSYVGGIPLTFRVGTGQVIKGWDEALLTMKKGEKRTLIIPYWLGYGVKGRPPTVPGRATLVFEVELLDFK